MGSPSYCKEIGGADCDDQKSNPIASSPCKKPKIDWFYSTRKKMALLKHNPSQTRITDYYSIANKVNLLAKSKRELMNAFHHAGDQHTRQVDFHSFFNKIIANAEKDASKLPHSRRHDSVVKKFATSLFLYGGPMAYNLIHQNMPDALPSLRTVQRMIHADYH